MTTHSADEFRNLYEQKGGKIVLRQVPLKSRRVKVDPEKVLSEQQLLQSLGIDPSTAIFIRGEVPSSKNSKRIFPRYTSKSSWKFNGKSAVPFITDSAFTEKYKKSVRGEFQSKVMEWKKLIAGVPLPLYVEFIFIRSTKQGWDYNNLTECPQDLMVETGWIEDDNTLVMLPCPPPPPGFLVDKNNAGVIIKLSKLYDSNRSSLRFKRRN